jgi:ATP-dependent Clp protease adapter protein ClpS
MARPEMRAGVGGVSFEELYGEVTPRLRPHLDGAAFDAERVERFARQAAAVALARGHRSVLVEHALRALCEEPSFVAALGHAGIDAEALRARLDDRLRRTFTSLKLAEPEALVQFACVQANLRGQTELSTRPLLVDLLRRPTVQAFEILAIPRYELLYALVHGAPPEEPEPAGAEVEVLFHDDDTTTMEHVVSVLREVFDADEETATKTMLAVHGGGSAVVARLPVHEARARVARAHALCRKQLMPLRVTLREPLVPREGATD